MSLPADARAWLDDLAEDMDRRWHAGEQPRVEEYLLLHPELADQPESALELIAEEIMLRQERGLAVDGDDLLRRFPQWRAQVQTLLNCHELLTSSAAIQFPEAGATLGDFRLRAELARGAHGQVFLAAQPALADRVVVLKLVPAVGNEHLSLARLQHTHIVPLYAVHDFPSYGLRGLCMPYFGRATLASLLHELDDCPAERRTGRDLVEALRKLEATSPAAVRVTGPACQALAEFSYVEALCWIGACLADALHYAAERGVVHLDLKPSNVLLAADGQPLLLDFHLARAPLPAGAPAPAWLGGTPGYMAPEQEAALTAVCEGRPLPMAVDHRADIRALGLVLYEALGGTLPPPADAAGELRRRNRQVSTGLADILVRCLAPDPAGRYPTAAALAADLRRHLADLPLRGVANRSLAERWRKWQRRRPFVVPLCTLLLGALAAGGAFLVHVERQSLKADAALREGQDHLQNQRYAEAADSFRHGLALVEDLPFNSRLQHQLREQHHCAERGQAAQELHLFCERLRPLYGANTVPSDRVREIEEHCRRFWEDRRRIADDILEAGPAALAPQLRADLLDLAILWTDLRVRRSPPDKIAAIRQEALDTLAEAERLLGPSVVLCQERKKHALALGMKEMAAAADRQAVTLRPTTAWEHCALGRAYFQAGDWTAAAAEMERSLELEPRALWPNFYKGTCAFHAGNYPDAVAAFSVCVVLAPESAWAWHNRGLAYTELGRLEPALADFTRALYLDATLVDATLWRGIAHYRAQHYGAALADLRRAHDQGADGATVAYHQALVHVARHNRPAALASIRQALRHDPAHPQAKQLLSSLESEP